MGGKNEKEKEKEMVNDEDTNSSVKPFSAIFSAQFEVC